MFSPTIMLGAIEVVDIWSDVFELDASPTPLEVDDMILDTEDTDSCIEASLGSSTDSITEEESMDEELFDLSCQERVSTTEAEIEDITTSSVFQEWISSFGAITCSSPPTVDFSAAKEMPPVDFSDWMKKLEPISRPIGEEMVIPSTSVPPPVKTQPIRTPFIVVISDGFGHTSVLTAKRGIPVYIYINQYSKMWGLRGGTFYYDDTEIQRGDTFITIGMSRYGGNIRAVYY